MNKAGLFYLIKLKVNSLLGLDSEYPFKACYKIQMWNNSLSLKTASVLEMEMIDVYKKTDARQDIITQFV